MRLTKAVVHQSDLSNATWLRNGLERATSMADAGHVRQLEGKKDRKNARLLS